MTQRVVCFHLGVCRRVNRVAYSDADVAGRKYVVKMMRSAGLEPRIDPGGNVFCRRQGSDSALKPILFGSHIDSVPGGGNFDGDLGSLSAIEVLRTMKEPRCHDPASARRRRIDCGSPDPDRGARGSTAPEYCPRRTARSGH